MIKTLDDIKLLVEETMPKDLAAVVMQFLTVDQPIHYSKVDEKGYLYGYYSEDALSPTLSAKRIGRFLCEGIHTILQGRYLYFMDRRGCTSKIDLLLFCSLSSSSLLTIAQFQTKLPKAPIAYKSNQEFSLRFLLKSMHIRQRLHLVLEGPVVLVLDLTEEKEGRGWHRLPRSETSLYCKLFAKANEHERQVLALSKRFRDEREDWIVATSRRDVLIWAIVGNTVSGFDASGRVVGSITFPVEMYPVELMSNRVDPSEFAVEVIHVPLFAKETSRVLWYVYQDQDTDVALVRVLDLGKLGNLANSGKSAKIKYTIH